MHYNIIYFLSLNAVFWHFANAIKKHEKKMFNCFLHNILHTEWLNCLLRMLNKSDVSQVKNKAKQTKLPFLSTLKFSHSFESDSLQPHGLKHTSPPCPSPTPGVYSNSCLLSRWCHPTISSSVVPFSSCLQSFSASGSFPMSQFFTQVAKVLEPRLQYQSLRWIFRIYFL